ncbi:MAG: S-layer homology domain-containing protein [Clostridia bacterium]|nr:S-layer homology domain-containing protein [Clostridia bacterium]
MKKRFCIGALALLVIVAMAVSALPTVFAVSYVATDGSANYDSLQAAIDAAGTTPTTITLLDNIDLGAGKITVGAGQNITIDFDGYRITGLVTAKLTANHFMIHNKGTLTLKTTRSGGGATLEYRGDSTNYGYTADTICNDVGGHLTVKSGDYYNNTNVSAQISYVLDCLTNGNTKTTTTVIDGGSFISPYYLCVRAFANGTAMNSLTINGGEFTGRITLQDSNVNANKSELIIKDGEFTANSCSSEVVYLYGNKDASNLSVSIEGGNYDGSVYLTSVNTTETFDAEISGGTFNEPVWVCTWDSSSEDTNVKAVTGGDFAYSVADYLDPSVPVELSDGGRFSYYPTVDDARDAASSSSATITVIPESPAGNLSLTLTDGGETVTYPGLAEGDVVALPTLYGTASLKFTGWADAEGNVYTASYTVGTENALLTAKWASIVYELVLDPSEGGSLKASFAYAGVGNKGVITAVPNEGFELKSITAVDAKGNAVPLTLENGSYSFTMLASKVTVSAVFGPSGDVLDAFDDVESDHEYADALRYCVENSILIGDGNGKLMPDGELDRAQAVVIIWRLAGSPISQGENVFADVEDCWYTDAVVWAAENGIALGNGMGGFMPEEGVTLEGFACFLARYSVLAGQSVESDLGSLESIADADSISAWARTEVAWALDNGLIKADSEGKLRACETASRGRIADVLWSYIEK